MGSTMLIRNFVRSVSGPRNTVKPTWTRPELVNGGFNIPTMSGQVVTVESAKRLATAYRCSNLISDHIAIMPLQTMIKRSGQPEQVQPDWLMRNIAYRLEIQPNRWQIPFIFKKLRAEWLIHHGNSYVWMPPGDTEMFLLPADATYSFIDKNGNLWHRTIFPDGFKADLPDVEVAKEMINSRDGINGRGVVTFARETMGIRQGAMTTEAGFMASGLNVSAVVRVAGELNPEARKRFKDELISSIGGSENAFGVAVVDQKVEQFTPVKMSAVDMQFLQLIGASDLDIANFYGVPLHMVNMGKMAYNSNDQKFDEYMSVTLNPYLVQGEQAGRTKWLRRDEQPYTYFKYVREALLQMDPDKRAKYNRTLIESGQRSPKEAREKDDYPAYPGSEKFYMASQIQPIGDKHAQPN